MAVNPAGPLSPYVTPSLLTSAPTGISWSTIPPGRDVTPAQRLAEQSNICQRATGMADSYCNQVLRATLDTEVFRGPDYRVTVLNGSGNGRIILQRWPVLDVVSIQIAPDAVFPRQWTTITAGHYEPEYPPIGVYGSTAPSSAGEGGQSIIIESGWINWGLGRNGWVIQVQYYNGWPHCGLTANATAGSTTIQVDDCTGWAITSPFSGITGATGTVFDPGQQETVQVTASSVTAGPGTLTLAAPLSFSHTSGILVSSLPQSIQWAVIKYGASIAMTRGSTATTVQTIPGGGDATGGVTNTNRFAAEAQQMLQPFKRVL
jgi:hypothetical protein